MKKNRQTGDASSRKHSNGNLLVLQFLLRFGFHVTTLKFNEIHFLEFITWHVEYAFQTRLENGDGVKNGGSHTPVKNWLKQRVSNTLSTHSGTSQPLIHLSKRLRAAVRETHIDGSAESGGIRQSQVLGHPRTRLLHLYSMINLTTPDHAIASNRPKQVLRIQIIRPLQPIFRHFLIQCPTRQA